MFRDKDDDKFYKFVNFKDDEVQAQLVDLSKLKANTPYLVKAEGAAEIVFKNGGMFNTTTGGASDNGYKVELSGTGWTIVGTYDYKTWDAGAYIYPMLAYLKYSDPAKVLSAPNSACASVSVTASLPETIDVVIVGDSSEETTVIGTLNTRTGELKAAGDRYFDLKGRNLGSKKPKAKGNFYNKGKKVTE